MYYELFFIEVRPKGYESRPMLPVCVKEISENKKLSFADAVKLAPYGSCALWVLDNVTEVINKLNARFGTDYDFYPIKSVLNDCEMENSEQVMCDDLWSKIVDCGKRNNFTFEQFESLVKLAGEMYSNGYVQGRDDYY